jgi:HlyD family secretion protein
MKKLLLFLFLLALLGSGGYLWVIKHDDRPATKFLTATVSRGSVIVSSNATGTLEPEEVVDVGAQVLGQIKNFGKTPEGGVIDYGTHVEEGTVLAHIDDTTYKSQVVQAQANLQKADADLELAQAKLRQAKRDWDRAQRVYPSAMSRTDYDSYQANYESTHASLSSATAARSQAQEALNQARINLSYTVIRSPVRGVIVDRRVNVGQTVVASLNAPSLFLIARDLKRMQIWAQVNEADIGRVKTHMPVEFSVDAFPDEVFHGEVTQVRLNANMQQNVVTYTVVVTFDNSQERLLPYLTANVRFEISRRDGVLRVPVAALQWRPKPAQVAPSAREAFEQIQAAAQASDAAPRRDAAGRHEAVVWVTDGSLVRPVTVWVGLSDGILTEVTGPLNENDQIVVGEDQAETEGTTNPFLPSFMRKGKAQAQ